MPAVEPNKSYKRVVAKLPLIRWILGAALLLMGGGMSAAYFIDYTRTALGAPGVLMLIAGIVLLVYSWRHRDGNADIVFQQRQQTVVRKGKEPNAIIVVARPGPNGAGKDTPVMVAVRHVDKIPPGARMHYVRNWKQHFYELVWLPREKRLAPVSMPDVKPFPPSLYVKPAVMHDFKDAMDYIPQDLMQKLKPVFLLVAMIVVGLLMVMTVTG